jgi:glycosyltransferase involved in cell wall biosynthesis
MYLSQTYTPTEWVILDDGEEKIGALFSGVPGVRYIPLETRLPMGAKLNILKREAQGDIVVVMDDDDYYPPERVSSVVQAFEKSPEVQVAGSSKVYMYYTDTDTIYCTGPYSDTHGLNCTLAWRRSYEGVYDANEPCAVESGFLSGFTVPMLQINTKKTILHIIHSSNTFNAIQARDKGTLGLMKKTSLTLENFIYEEGMREQFLGAY